MGEYFKQDLKCWLQNFKVPFIITGIILAAFLISFITTKNYVPTSDEIYYESPNTERVYGDQRVFDYADQLTDSEEERLEAYIHTAEQKTCLDIVIVTLNESLADYEPEYRSKYTVDITPDKYVMVYADKFWEDNKFGYNGAQVLDGTTTTGDGVILVDNLYREPETGKIYTWMGTTGKAEERYSSSMIDYALDCFYEDIDYDYYDACTDFIDCVVSDMELKGVKYEQSSSLQLSSGPVFLGLMFALFYFLTNHKEKAGKKTTDARTYLETNSLEFPVRVDRFLTKTVTKHYNPPQESSGGGGGGGSHSSGGGGSHGGGGHSR